MRFTKLKKYSKDMEFVPASEYECDCYKCQNGGCDCQYCVSKKEKK